MPRKYKSHGGTECSRCDNPPAPGQKYCLACRAAWMREWRKTHPLTEAQKIKDRARSYARVYKCRGKLLEQPCRVCGAKAQMHHPDYSKPLLVEWLCRRHHLDLH